MIKKQTFAEVYSHLTGSYSNKDSLTDTLYDADFSYKSLLQGTKRYELSNHLGNVLAVISDQWRTYCTTTSAIVGSDTIYTTTFDRYEATIIQATDYSAFGAPLPGRTWSEPSVSSKYKMGFNGKMMDNETYGDGNIYDYGFRIYDPRVARFLSTDPLFQSYPWYTPYQFAGNKPIFAIDLDGLEEYAAIYHQDAAGNYYYRLHVIKEKEVGVPLKISYYARPLATTNGGDQRFISKKATDQFITTKVSGVDGVTDDNIWASTALKDAAKNADEVFHKDKTNSGLGEAGPDATFSGTISFTETTDASEGYPVHIDGSSAPISPEKMTAYFKTDAKVKADVKACIKTAKTNSGSEAVAVTFYAKNEEAKKSLLAALPPSTPGTTTPTVIVDPTKAGGSPDAFTYEFSKKVKTPDTVTIDQTGAK